MATKVAKFLKNRAVAKLVTENRQPCVFCQQDVDDEVIYGKLYSLGDIQCHYFCVLLSCCLVQKGKDSEGLFGFLYKDILAEVERSKKHKCSYCGRGGASMGCAVAACRKQFHLPCGRQKNTVSLFYGNYKSFCSLHAPKQKISDSVMVNARARMKRDRLIRAGKMPISSKENKQTEEESAMVCVICYEEVQGYPTTQTFWPPCCGRDAWLHRSCLQRMALSAGMHYIKCPLCNDKENFYDAVCDQGYYLPDRDAAWELEQNAFAEMYARDAACAAVDCKCPFGRTHDELGIWDIKLCLLCGSWGMHAHCSGGERLVCASCRPAAEDIDSLEPRLAAVILAEQAREQRNARSGPVMPSRMSLRRTKGRVQPHSSTSSSQDLPTHDAIQIKTEPQSMKDTDRLDLNLKTPRRPKLLTPSLKDLETKLLSPIKMLEQSYLEKGGGGDVVVTSEVIEKIRLKFSKPKPLSAKKKILNEILDDLFKNVYKDSLKSKDPIKEWNSPKKSFDITNDTCEELMKNPERIVNATESMEVDENPETGSEKADESTAVEGEILLISDEEECEIVNENFKEALPEEKTAILKETDEKDNDAQSLPEGTDDKENDANDSADNANLDVNDAAEEKNTKIVEDMDTKNDDESSNSTFYLPSEFVAESDDSLPIFDTPKKLKTVDFKEDSSIEISAKDEVVNIDVVQIGSGKEKEFIKGLTFKSPVKSMCTFKFSPSNKDILLDSNVDMDIESFKEQYLNEVDKDFKSKKDMSNDDCKVSNAEDNTNRKRKLEMKEVVMKKRKKSKLKIKIKTERKRSKKRKKAKELKRKLATDTHITVKIKLRDAKSKIKKSKKKQKVKSFQQYVLNYSPTQTDKVIGKPDAEIIPIKRKYTKTEKTGDNLVQTSIQSFFKAK